MKKAVLFIALAFALVLVAADKRSFDTWQSYGSGPDSSQYSSLKQINKSNVKQLQMAWSYPIGGGALTFGPLVVGRHDVSSRRRAPSSRSTPPPGKELLDAPGRAVRRA